ncbi:hypothetical protein W02_29540 [Nitrospira sp. KM1]|nr:hypothetical protein W02_29540 [Nitrospira sp. KM1]
MKEKVEGGSPPEDRARSIGLQIILPLCPVRMAGDSALNPAEQARNEQTVG